RHTRCLSDWSSDVCSSDLAVDIDHLFLVASHTHHGPVLELDDWPSAKKPYVRELEQKLADVIAEAAKAIKPARLGIASKEVPFKIGRASCRERGAQEVCRG